MTQRKIKENSKFNISKVNKYVENSPSTLVMLSSMFGVLGTLATTPLQHPGEVLKSNWQTNPQLKNELEVAKIIKGTKGLKGFYSGYLANGARQAFKSSYRYPLVAILPQVYSKILEGDFERNKYKNKLLTSLTITSLEAGLITPFERIQVFAMTSAKHSKYSEFYQLFDKELFRQLYKGFWPYFTKQVVSWTMWLQTDTFVKEKMRQGFRIPEEEMITGWKLGIGTLLVSFGTIAVTMPFDSMKTHLEKHQNDLQEVKVEEGKAKKTLSIPEAMKRVYERGGTPGFFVGWRLKLLSYLITSILATTMIEYFDHLAKKAFKE